MTQGKLEIDPQRRKEFDRFKADEDAIFEYAAPAERVTWAKILQAGRFITSSPCYLRVSRDPTGQITLPRGTVVDRGSGTLARLKKPLMVVVESLDYGLGAAALPDGSRIYFACHLQRNLPT